MPPELRPANPDTHVDIHLIRKEEPYVAPVKYVEIPLPISLLLHAAL